MPPLFRWCVLAVLFSASTTMACPQNPSAQCSADYKSTAAQPSVTVSIEPSQPLVRNTTQVAPHQALQYNFPLTAGTALVARFLVSGGANGSIKVWLLDSTNFQLYQAHRQYSYFQGTSGSVRGVGHYVFRVPRDDIYYLLLDNSGAWLLPRTVNLYAYSVLPVKSPETLAAEKTAADNFSKLGQVFIFPQFHLDIRHCGVANAFSNPNITVCTELVEELQEKQLGEAAGFVLFHELGHTLLRTWGYPLWDNEDAADEFATVMLIIAKQQKTALEAAQYWASKTSDQEAMAKIWMDDRHTLSPQRARNIIHWLNQQDDLLQRWFRVFVPNLQTNALFGAFNDSDRRIDKEAVRAELQRRGCTLP